MHRHDSPPGRQQWTPVIATEAMQFLTSSIFWASRLVLLLALYYVSASSLHFSLTHFNPGCPSSAQRSFAQSPDELKTKYKSLMAEFHPDRHASSPEEEKTAKSLMATEITRAYSIVGDPLSRALHLLELHGASIDESDRVSHQHMQEEYALLPSQCLISFSVIHTEPRGISQS